MARITCQRLAREQVEKCDLDAGERYSACRIAARRGGGECGVRSGGGERANLDACRTRGLSTMLLYILVPGGC